MSLRRNTMWNIAGSGLPLIAAAALIPSTLRQLGNEAFGVLTLIWALIGYFGLFDLGVGRALTYEISKLRAANALGEITPTLKAGLLLTSVAGILGALIFMVLAPWLAQNWLQISPVWQRDAQLAFQIAAIGVVPATITSGLRGALEGLECFAASNLNKIFLGFCMFVLPALSVRLHGKILWTIALYLVAARLLVVLGSALPLRRLLSGPNSDLALHYVRPLLSYGGWITVTGIVGPLMIYGDRFFVGSAVGAMTLPLYAIPQEGLQRLLIIPAALCGALLPQFASLEPRALIDAYHRNYKRIAVTMLGICAAAALFAYPFLSLWLSPEFAQKALPIAVILAVGVWLNSMALVPYTFLHACGNPRITALFHLAELVIYILALYYLVAQFALVGAALAWVVRVLIDLILLHVSVHRFIGYIHKNN